MKQFPYGLYFLLEELADCYRQSIRLIHAEDALYWRVICGHLQMEAQVRFLNSFHTSTLLWDGVESYPADPRIKTIRCLQQEKGFDAATKMGTEAAIYAAEASDSNDLLEKILPATISDYIDLVRAHVNAGKQGSSFQDVRILLLKVLTFKLFAGPNYQFTSRQLLLLGAILDFSDATNRKNAGAFVRELLLKPLEHETDDEGNKVALGDCINLGGDREWADAVAGFARRVHSAFGEFEESVLEVVEELVRACRERTADCIQWMHCLAVTGLLLENVKSFGSVRSRTIELDDLLQFLLLPGVQCNQNFHGYLLFRCFMTICGELFTIQAHFYLGDTVSLVIQLTLYCTIMITASILELYFLY